MIESIIVELYALKPFCLGAFITWYTMKKLNKKPTTFEIREF